jgi:hypothetical protein
LTESAFAEDPASNPPTTILRFKSETLKHNNVTVVSEEIRADRQRSDLVLVGFDTAGDMNFELSYSNFDWLFEAALCGTWASDILTNGVTNRSFNIEKGFLDIGQYMQFRGSVINRLLIDGTSRKIVQVTAGIMGSTAFAGSTSLGGTTTPTDPSDTEVIASGTDITFQAVGGVGPVELNGVHSKEIKLDINNNCRIRDLVTQPQTEDLGRGVMDITGSLNCYFEDLVAYNAFLANGFCQLAFTYADPTTPAGNTYRFTLPRIKLPDANPTIGGVDSDVMQPITFRALDDPDVGYAIQIERGVTL